MGCTAREFAPLTDNMDDVYHGLQAAQSALHTIETAIAAEWPYNRNGDILFRAGRMIQEAKMKLDEAENMISDAEVLAD